MSGRQHMLRNYSPETAASSKGRGCSCRVHSYNPSRLDGWFSKKSKARQS